MRALLDVNVVIALLDPDHAFHERAHVWWAAQAKSGWASCPFVEDEVVRIMSNPAYSQGARFTRGDLIAAERIRSSRQFTDLYLLALASQHAGRLATFDQAIPISAVCGAKVERLCVI